MRTWTVLGLGSLLSAGLALAGCQNTTSSRPATKEWVPSGGPARVGELQTQPGSNPGLRATRRRRASRAPAASLWPARPWRPAHAHATDAGHQPATAGTAAGRQHVADNVQFHWLEPGAAAHGRADAFPAATDPADHGLAVWPGADADEYELSGDGSEPADATESGSGQRPADDLPGPSMPAQSAVPGLPPVPQDTLLLPGPTPVR